MSGSCHSEEHVREPKFCYSEEEVKETLKEEVLRLDRCEKPIYWETWGFGLAMVTATAFAAAIAILCAPHLSKRIYSRLLTFLVALGVGNLTGCTFFVLFPQAFHISKLGNADYVAKAWMTLGGCYLLFIFEKIIDFWAETKKKKKVQSALKERSTPELGMEPHVESPPPMRIEEYNGRIAAESVSPRLSTTMPTTTTTASPTHTPTMKPHNNHHITHHATPRNHHHQKPNLPSQPVSKKAIESELQSEALLALLGGWANNFIDGMAVGVSFGDNPLHGLTMGLAILSQQFPQEVDGLMIVMSTGVGLKRALLLNLVQAALSYIGFVIAVVVDSHFEEFDTFIYAVAAGNYLYICLGCLVPEMSEKVAEHIKVDTKEGLITTILQFCGIIIGLFFMFFMSLVGKNINLQKEH
uniref:Uncharacterized protein n=1 Tax=Plectus sambesii TaxID=2011161 RepID=A0A914WBL3_9BILA